MRKGSKHNKESKLKISDTRKRLFQEQKLISYWKGKAFSDEHKNKLSKSKKGVPNPKTKEKRRILFEKGLLNTNSETMKKKYASKEIVPWNKGLTKEIDERVRSIGNKNKISLKGNKQSMKSNKKRGISLKRWYSNEGNNKKILEKNLKISKKAGKVLLKKSKSALPQNIYGLYVEKGYSCEAISKMCGLSRQTVNRWLDRLGIQKRKSIYKQSNRRLRSDDGHLVDSNFEREVDNWLYSHRIPHSVHTRIFNDRRFLTDFKVGDIFIECDGLTDNRINKKSFEEKIRLYKKNNLKFLILIPNDDINLKLSILLKRYNIIDNSLKDNLDSIQNNKIIWK